MATHLAFSALGMTIFLISIRVMSRSLRQMAGSRLHVFLLRLTGSPLSGMCTGMVATACIQSSSAVAAAMVALVDSRLLSLEQAFGVILGANIGTTITAQIVSLRLDTWAYPLIVFGAIVALAQLGRPGQRIGVALIGLGSLFFGMNLMRQGLHPLAAAPIVSSMLSHLAANSFLGIVAGIITTALVQSSSAVTGLTIALAGEGLLTLESAVAIALGSNIGTVATTLIVSIGTTLEARRTALADLIFNLAGVCFTFPFMKSFVSLVSLSAPTVERQIANAHTLFNVVTAVLTLPLIPYLSKALSRLGANNAHLRL